MRRRFAAEIWRAVKYLLITGAVSVAFAQLYRVLITQVLAADTVHVGLGLSVLSYVSLFFSTSITTLLNRYFTFRATEKWYIALPLMLVAAFGWNWLTSLAMMLAARTVSANIVSQASTLLSVLWIVTAYLLQCCAIYCHTADANRWYARLHPTDAQGEDTDE